MPETSVPQQQTHEDIQGWQEVADTMHTWHPDLRAHAERVIQERGIPVNIGQQALVDAVEAVGLSLVTHEINQTLQQLPEIEYPRSWSSSRDDKSYPRATALTEVALLSKELPDGFFASIQTVDNKYKRLRMLEKLIPVAAATGRAQELINAALDDDKSDYHQNELRAGLARELAKTDPDAALALAKQLSSRDSSDEVAYSKGELYADLIELAPTAAPKLYEAVKTDVANLSNPDDKRFYVDSLVKLAGQIPEAGQQALEILTSPPTSRSERFAFDRAEQLAALSASVPEALVPAAEGLKSAFSALQQGYRMSFQEDQIGNATKAVRTAITQAINTDRYDIATTATTTAEGCLRGDVVHELRSQLFNDCLRNGDAHLALANADHNSTEAFARVMPLLVQQGDTATIRAHIEQLKGTARINALVKAACYAPEFIEDVKAAITAESRYGAWEFRHALENIDIFAANVGGVKEILAMVPHDIHIGVGKTRLELAKVDLETRQEELARIRKLKDPVSQMGGLLTLSGSDPELLSEAFNIFKTTILPELANEDSKSTINRDMPSLAPSLARELEANGRHEDALEVTGSQEGYAFAACARELTPSTAEEAVRGLISIGNMIHHEGGLDHLGLYTEKIAAALSDEQLRELLATIPEKKSTLRALLVEKLMPRCITNGMTAELFSLMPEDSGGSYSTVFREIATELTAHPGQPGLTEALNKIVDDRYCLQALLPLLPSNPDLVPLALSRLDTLSGYNTDTLKTQVLSGLISLTPEGASHALAFAQSLNLQPYDNRKINENIASVTQLAEAFAENGNGNEAFELIQLLPSGRTQQAVFKKIAPDLVEHGWAGIALDYARGITSPAERAECLAVLTQHESEGWVEKSMVASSLFGKRALELAPHIASDRSVNINLFIDDIAEHPLIVEALVARASNPAEILRVMQAVDQAASQTEDGARLQMHALETLLHFATSDAMKKRWSEERQEQALGGKKADTQLFTHLANLQQLTSNLANLDKYTLPRLLKAGYTAEQLFTHPWLATGEIADLGPDVYPFTKGISTQQEWLADHAFVRLDGFNRRAIGRLLETRLNNNLEYSLHDASQWLQHFAVPDSLETYNAAADTVEQHRLKDVSAEEDFLATVLHSSFTTDELQHLPGFASAGGDMSELKTQKFETLFSEPAHTVLYAALLQAHAQAGSASTGDLQQLLKAWSEAGVIDMWVSHGKDITGDNANLTDRILEIADKISERPAAPEKIPSQLNYLRELGRDRSAYVDSTLTWIRSYQNLSGQKLAFAWTNRLNALRAGIEDKPAAIEEWTKTQELHVYFMNHVVDNSGNLPSGVSPSVLLQRFPKFIPELPSRYGLESSARALEHLNQVFNAEADLPARQIPLDSGYTFKVFAKDDPAGMTIGNDTDCCMRIGGASESCIFNGYSQPSCGFVGLYDSNNKLVAHSFVWHNEGTLVLDNIETQRGHNIANIQDQYKTALETYLKDLHATKPELGLHAVNLGTGYLAARLSEGLQQTQAVQPQVRLGYSDAHNQLRLIHLTAEELASQPAPVELPAHNTSNKSPRPPQAHPEFVTVLSPSSQASEISRLEAQIYPNALQTGHDEILSDLTQPNNFSFLIGSRTGNSGFVGYVLAHRSDSDDAVYVSDLAVLPEEQRNGYGIAAIEHLFRQITAAGEKRIIFEARESTSYQALQTPKVQALFAKHGYGVVSSVLLSNHFANNENAYSIELVQQAA